MQITIDRQEWLGLEPDLVVLVGDPHQDFCGKFDQAFQAKIDELSQGFTAGTLTREVNFSFPKGFDTGLVDYVYYHTSLEKGFTATENLKTFLSRALWLAADTGRKKVAMCLRGEHGEGMLEQLVEGALVGTYKFTDFLKDGRDKFADVELVICLPPLTAAAPKEAAVEAPSSAPVEEPDTLEEPKAELALEEAQTAEEQSHTIALEDKEIDKLVASLSGGESEGPPIAAPSLAGDPAETDGGSGADELTPAEESAGDNLLVDEVQPVEPIEAQEEASAAPSLLESDACYEERAAQVKALDEAALRVGRTFGEGVNYARTLISQPASVCTPNYLAKAGEELAKKYGFSYEAFGPKELEKQGFAGHLAVGSGSANPPKMFQLTYSPQGASDVHLVLLGKGVTFDTGGISIKPSEKMHLMIGDMSGAAAVLATMQILGELRPSIKVTGIVVSAENSPDGKSFRPGDILRYKNGVSVHVENTDGEGRLLLADGLIRAGEIGATHIVDIATLTGACARALGPSFTGIMGASRKLVSAITRAGGNQGEAYWRLPMPVEYKSMLKDFRADVNNFGGPYAGATTAALFLQEFAPKGAVWAHLDIAGTFWKTKAWKYYQEGPSGTGVKTLADLALRWREHMG